jgi:hypothetical protein
MVVGTVYGIVKLTAPAAVPDHATVFGATQPMAFAGTITLAQRFTPKRDHLTAIDVLLAAENKTLPGSVLLEIQAWPTREVLRTARVPAASIPSLHIWELRPGQPKEQWTTFGFAPITVAEGAELLFQLSYADGTDQPGWRVATLARFPSNYRPNEMFVNGFSQNGNLLFRLASAGMRGQAIGGAGANLARLQPVYSGTLVAPGVLAACCALLAGVIIRSIIRFH